MKCRCHEIDWDAIAKAYAAQCEAGLRVIAAANRRYDEHYQQAVSTDSGQKMDRPQRTAELGRVDSLD